MRYDTLVDGLLELDPTLSAAGYLMEHRKEESEGQIRARNRAFSRCRLSTGEVNSLTIEFLSAFEYYDLGNDWLWAHCRHLLSGNRARRMVEFDPQSILEPLLAHEKACWVRVVLDIAFEARAEAWEIARSRVSFLNHWQYALPSLASRRHHERLARLAIKGAYR
jgi:hypothetical protein